MTIVLVSLSVFVVMKLVDEVLDLPSWLRILLVTGLSSGGLWIAGDNPGWGLAAAALALAWDLVEAVVMAVRDWVRVSVLVRGTRR